MDIRAAQNELGEVLARHRAITTEYAGKEIPAEKRAEQEKLHARGMELRAAIEASLKAAEESASLDALQAFLEKPAPKVPLGSVSDVKDGRAALEKAGWEIRNGWLFAPTSLGTHVQMWHEKVLWGTMPKSEDGREFYRQTRAAFQPGYREAYSNFLLNVARSRDLGLALGQLSPSEQAALSEGVDTAGGYLVPVDVQAEMLARTAQKGVMRKYATVQPTNSDKVKYPRVQAAAATAGGMASGGGSIFSSGFIGDWAGETPAFTDTDPAFGTFEIAVKKIRVGTKLSNDFMNDAAIDVLSFLAKNGSENMALVEDKGFFSGNGAALQPKGILNSGAATVDVEGSTANTISNTTAALGTAPKITDLIFALPAQYAADPAFVFTRTSEGKLRKLVDANGRPYWPLKDDGNEKFAGFRKDNSPFMQEDGTDANKVAVFGDLSAYVIAQRAQISTVILRERFADTDQVGILLFERVGGDLWNEDAIRFGIV